MAAKSTGLGSRFVTPQRAKVERSGQFQKMDLFGSQNLSKPKDRTIQPFEQPLDISNPSTGIFASPDMLNTYNSSLQANLADYVPNKNTSQQLVDSQKLDMLQRVANQGGPVDGTDFGALTDKRTNDTFKRYGMQNSNIPKAGQALSEPYKPNKAANASNSSFDYTNFKNVLRSVRDEQNFYKELSDPNFKILSEEEMAKQADERFNKDYANKTWKDLYQAPNLANLEKGIGFNSPEYRVRAAQEGAADLFNRNKSRARNSILSELRQQQASKQYFDSEEGKKRVDAGKKLLDFYGTQTGLADNTSYMYGLDEERNRLDPRVKGASFTFYDMLGSGNLGGVNPTPTTEYQKRYADELKKQGEGVSKRLTVEEHKKIRDMITDDFNKSIGFTGKFIPFKYNKFNLGAYDKGFFENPMKNPMTQQTYDDATLKQLFSKGALNYDPTAKYKSRFV